jgi:hypothetical protein
MTIGPLTFYPSLDYYRPSIWLKLPQSELVLFLGWQKPSLLWLR